MKRKFCLFTFIIILIISGCIAANYYINSKPENDFSNVDTELTSGDENDSSNVVRELTSSDGVHFTFSPEEKTLIISGEKADSHESTQKIDYWLENTEKIIIADGVKEIDASLYCYYNAKEIVISESVEKIDYDLFFSALEKYTVDKNNKYYYSDKNGVLYSYNEPVKGGDTLEKIPVKSAQETYTLPENVKYITSEAFEECEYLRFVNIGKNYDGGLTNVLEHCPYIETVTIHKDNKSYCNDNQGVVYDKEMTMVCYIPHAVEEFVVPDDVKFSFNSRCSNLGVKKLVIGNTCPPLHYFKNLDEIVIDEANDSICAVDNVVFSKDMTVLKFYPPMKADKTYEIPSSVLTIESDSLYCKKLKKLIIPDSVKYINERAFYNASGLERVKIGKGVQKIDGQDGWIDYIDNPFIECDNLKSITVSKENEHYANDKYGALYSKDMKNLLAYPSKSIFKKFSVPDTVTEINYCFSNCTEIEVINFGKNVETITVSAYGDGYSFYGFEDCFSLREINVSDENEFFTSDDGILYTKSKNYLIMYPPAKKGESFVIPDYLVGFGNFPFRNVRYLERVYVPKSIPRPDYSFAFANGDLTLYDICFDIYFEGTYNEWHSIWFDKCMLYTDHKVYYDVKEFPQ